MNSEHSVQPMSNRLKFFNKKIAPSMEQIRISNAKNSPQFTGATGPLNGICKGVFQVSASHELKRSRRYRNNHHVRKITFSTSLAEIPRNVGIFYGMALALPLANWNQTGIPSAIS